MNNVCQRARDYLAAYAAKDLARISAMLAPDVYLRDWNISGAGKDFFIAETDKNFRAANKIEIHEVMMLNRGMTVAAQLEIYLDDKKESLDVVDVISFNESGEILGVRAYKS